MAKVVPAPVKPKACPEPPREAKTIYDGWVQCSFCGASWRIKAVLDPNYNSRDVLYCGVKGCNLLIFDPCWKGLCSSYDRVRIYVYDFLPPQADGRYTCSRCGRVTGYKYTWYGCRGTTLRCAVCGASPSPYDPTRGQRVYYWEEPGASTPQPTEPSSVSVTVSGRTFTVNTVPSTAPIKSFDITIYIQQLWWRQTIRNLSTTQKSITWDGRNDRGSICTPGWYNWEAYVTGPTGKRWGPYRGAVKW
jgi:transcription elongation factor Elf1